MEPTTATEDKVLRDIAREFCQRKTLDENGAHDKFCRGCSDITALRKAYQLGQAERAAALSK